MGFVFRAVVGIRCRTVTGVQSCALPIGSSGRSPTTACRSTRTMRTWRSRTACPSATAQAGARSEERRVGGDGRVRGGGDYGEARDVWCAEDKQEGEECLVEVCKSW